jgi:hypothetical protein
MRRLAVRAPTAFGLNLTLMVQLAPPARLVPQVWLRVKSLLLAPVRLMPVMLRAPLPLLVKVTTLAALVVPTARAAKLRLAGDKDTAVPVPLKLTVCGLVGSESLRRRLAVRAPAPFGLKLTLRVQLAPPARLVPQVLVWAKSLLLAPTRLMPVMLRAVLPLLVKVTTLAGLVVPMTRVGKLRLLADKETAVPVPLKLTLCGLLVALSVRVREPVRVPAAVGLKVTVMLQLAPPARLVPQLLVWAKSPLAVILLRLKADCPVLDKVRVFGLLGVPRSLVPKLKLEADSFATGPVPVAPSTTRRMRLLALSAM